MSHLLGGTVLVAAVAIAAPVWPQARTNGTASTRGGTTFGSTAQRRRDKRKSGDGTARRRASDDP